MHFLRLLEGGGEEEGVGAAAARPGAAAVTAGAVGMEDNDQLHNFDLFLLSLSSILFLQRQWKVQEPNEEQPEKGCGGGGRRLCGVSDWKGNIKVSPEGGKFVKGGYYLH